MQAAAAFEMTRSFHGEHFKLREHLQRLLDSCRALSLSFPWTLDEVEQLCHETARRNEHGLHEEHRLLIVVSPGCAPMYRKLDGVIPHPFLYIADFPLKASTV
jgi:branched-subunit amino acid aminotransferase/4-amino-4-deoxychorismate lyase